MTALLSRVSWIPSICQTPRPSFSIHPAAIYRLLSYSPHLHPRMLSIFSETPGPSRETVTPNPPFCQLLQIIDYENPAPSSPLPMINGEIVPAKRGGPKKPPCIAFVGTSFFAAERSTPP